MTQEDLDIVQEADTKVALDKRYVRLHQRTTDKNTAAK